MKLQDDQNVFSTERETTLAGSTLYFRDLGFVFIHPLLRSFYFLMDKRSQAHQFGHPVNRLNLNINMHVPVSVRQIFLMFLVGGNFPKHQGIYFLVIISSILMTCAFDQLAML